MNDEHLTQQPGQTTEEIKKEHKQSGNKNLWLWTAIPIVAIVLASGAAVWYFFFNNTSNRQDEAVAIVNGQQIPRSEFETSLSQMISLYSQQGIDIENSEEELSQLKNQIIDNLVVETILLQAAAKDEISVEDNEVSEQISQIRAGFEDEEAYQAALSSEGFTENSLRAYVTKRVIVEDYLTAKLDLNSLSVSDQEIEEFFNQQFVGMDEPPALGEVREQIESQLIQQKQQQLITELISQLREESDIEIMI